MTADDDDDDDDDEEEEEEDELHSVLRRLLPEMRGGEKENNDK